VADHPVYSIHAPVAPDGSFTVDGVPRGEARVLAAIDGLSDNVMGGVTVSVRGATVRGLALSLAKSTRVIHVLVRKPVNTRLGTPRSWSCRAGSHRAMRSRSTAGSAAAASAWPASSR